jgi:hypothetical protein
VTSEGMLCRTRRIFSRVPSEQDPPRRTGEIATFRQHAEWQLDVLAEHGDLERAGW